MVYVNRGMNVEKLAKFLRFCTGASMICVEQIQVSFSDIEGAVRRPIAHICGCVLELPRYHMNRSLNSEKK